MIEVRNPNTGQKGQVIEWNDSRRSLKLKSGILVLDRQCQWQYYNDVQEKWMSVFHLNRSN